MKTAAGAELFPAWSTPLIADACVRLQLPLKMAPPGVRPVMRWMRLAGPVCPVRHFGSVDVFLERAETARRGDVVVIDNGGRLDEGCIGDLGALELRAAGCAGALIWGVHRDTAELMRLEWPVFSYGAFAAGPLRNDVRSPDVFAAAWVGPWPVTEDDFVLADDDGVIFVPRLRVGEVIAAAREIYVTERQQANRVRKGISLREQFRFAEYLAARRTEPARTFRAHLRGLRGAMEE